MYWQTLGNSPRSLKITTTETIETVVHAFVSPKSTRSVKALSKLSCQYLASEENPDAVVSALEISVRYCDAVGSMFFERGHVSLYVQVIQILAGCEENPRKPGVDACMYNEYNVKIEINIQLEPKNV